MFPERLDYLPVPGSRLAAEANACGPVAADSPKLRRQLSFAQERLWYLHRFLKLPATLNLAFGFELNGPIDSAALAAALSRVLDRHEILRCSFDSDEPAAIVHPDVQMPLEFSNAEQEEGDAMGAALKLIMRAEREPFSLEHCPLMRAGLVQLGAQSYVLWFVAHRLVFDRSSIRPLLSDLHSAYRASTGAVIETLTALPAQYTDNARHQRTQASSQDAIWKSNYWREYLPQPVPVLDLPGDHNRPTVKSYLGGSIRKEVSTGTTVELDRLAGAQGCRLETLLLTAFSLLLHAHTGHETIIPGLLVSNRAFPGGRDMIGQFENVLPIPMRFAKDVRFSDLLMETHWRCSEAALQSHVPFEYVLTQVEIERDPSRPPICAATFSYSDASDHPPTHLAEATLSPIYLCSSNCMADLALRVRAREQNLEFILEFSSDIYEEATATYFLERYRTLLRHIIEAPMSTLSELSVLTEGELRQLQEWNQTWTGYEEICPIALIERQVVRSPDATAVLFQDECYSYDRLDREANSLAACLLRNELGPGDMVGIFMERSPRAIAALLAVWKAGAAYVPLDPHHPKERIAYVAKDSGMRVAFVSHSLQQEFPLPEVRCLCVERELELSNTSTNALERTTSSLDDLAYVIYTSGSTGRPKGVEVTCRGVSNYLQAVQQKPGFKAGETTLALTTFSFDISVTEVFLPLIAGGRLALVSSEVAADPFALQKVIDRWQPSLLQATPATWRMLIDGGWAGRKDARIMVGGEALSPELALLLMARSAELWNVYGPTETTVWTTLWKVEPNRRILIGCQIPNTTAYVVDRYNKLAPIGIPGELYLGGVQLARGYRGRPDLTAERFIPDPFSGGDGRLYRTGDLARYCRDGNLEFFGRIDHQVKIRGFRIELGEIESVLREDPSIAAAVVVAREDDGEKYLVAYVILQPPAALSLEKLRIHLRSRLPDYMIPGYFVSLDRFPVTPTGKIDRLALPKPDQTPSRRPSESEECRDDVERRLVEIWKSLLPAQSVHPSDNFFEVGGNSLLAVRVMVQIEKAWGKRLAIAKLFEAPTIRQLARLIRSEAAADRFSCIVPIQTQGNNPPIFMIHGLGGNVVGYYPLAQYLRPYQPVYGIQAVGADGKQPPLDDVTEMAARYVEEIRAVQKHGPYFLGGLSLGGAIALEIAELLRYRGEEVGALIMLDAYAYGVEKLTSVGERFRGWIATTGRRIVLHTKDLATAPDRLEHLRKKAKTIRRRTIWRLHARRYKKFIPGLDELPANYNAVAHAAWTAITRYVPKSYEGRVLVLRANDEPFLLHNDPTLGWGSLVGTGLTVRAISGNHLTLLVEPNVRQVAVQILDYMNSVLSTSTTVGVESSMHAVAG